MDQAIDGRCHCGAVTFRIATLPERATICNCSVCRRYGAIWAYGWANEDVWTEDPDRLRAQYVHGDREIGFHHCIRCGCITDWQGLVPHVTPNGERTRIAVNLRLADPGAVALIPLRLFDGADAFMERPGDGRCIADIVV